MAKMEDPQKMTKEEIWGGRVVEALETGFYNVLLHIQEFSSHSLSANFQKYLAEYN